MRWWGILLGVALFVLAGQQAFALCDMTLDGGTCTIPYRQCPDPENPRCIIPPASCPRADPGYPFVCEDTSGNFWQSVKFGQAYMVTQLVCPGPDVKFRQMAHPINAPSWPITIGDGSDAGFQDEVNNAPYRGTIDQRYGSGLYTDGNDQPSTTPNPPGLNPCGSYTGSADCYYVGNTYSTKYNVGSFPGPSLAVGTWDVSIDYNKYHMFRSDSPSTISQWNMDSLATNHIALEYPYYNLVTNWGATNLYTCCGSWKTMRAGSDGRSWSGGAWYFTTDNDAQELETAGTHVCCADNQCFHENSCLPQGRMDNGDEGTYSASYKSNSWVCGRDGNDPVGFYKCDSTKVGQSLDLGAGQRYCCQQVGAAYEFVDGLCGAGGGNGQRRAGGTSWHTTPPDQLVPAACSEFGTRSAADCNDQDSRCCNDGGIASEGYCISPAAGTTIGQGTDQGITKICAPRLGSTDPYDRPSVYECTSAVTYVNSATLNPDNTAYARGQYEGGSTAFCCVAKDPYTGVCAPKFVSAGGGNCESICGADGAACQCTPPPVGSDVFIGDGTNYGQSNPYYDRNQGATWEDTRELPLDPAVLDNRPDLSCTTNTQCTTLNAGDNRCYNSGTTGLWGGGSQWVCGGDSAGLPAWYICWANSSDGGITADAGYFGVTYPGTNKCCWWDATNGFRFITPNSSCDGDVCVHECDIGDRECVGSGYRRCVTNAEGCREWQIYTCPSTQCSTGSCSGGYCDSTCNAGNACDPPADPGTLGYCLNNLLCGCADCDRDNDGQTTNASDDRASLPNPSSTCTARNDCRDNNPAVKLGQVETAINSTGGTMCRDGYDNDCEIYGREADYDGGYGNNAVQLNEGFVMGDSACKVGIASPVNAPGNIDTVAACSASTFSVSCTANVGSVRSVEIMSYPEGTNPNLGTNVLGCVPTPDAPPSWGWTGNTMNWVCNVPSQDDRYEIRCYVNEDESYPLNLAPHASQRTTVVDVDCSSTVSGTVRDATDGLPIDQATVAADGPTSSSVLSGPNGLYTLNLRYGTYDFVASKSGFEPDESNRDVVIDVDPFSLDFSLLPEQCQADCTMGGLCNYDCIGVNGCTWDPSTLGYEAEIEYLCDNQPDGTLRTLTSDPDKEVLCCRGPLRESTFSRTPLLVSSCAEYQVPMTRLVSYNGQLYRLTVISYRSCE